MSIDGFISPSQNFIILLVFVLIFGFDDSDVVE